MLINYKDFENENKDKIYEVIELINKVADVDIINYARKLKSFLFEINFDNVSGMN